MKKLHGKLQAKRRKIHEKAEKKRIKLHHKLKGKKEKMKNKALKLAGLALCLGAITGCKSADPASRANSSEFDELISGIRVDNKSSLVINLTMGDGLCASADGGGDTQSNTPNQATDFSDINSVVLG